VEKLWKTQRPVEKNGKTNTYPLFPQGKFSTSCGKVDKLVLNIVSKRVL
jgi:hypothetical protein